MLKKETLIYHSQLANEMMYYIYEYIDLDINIDEIAYDFGISKYHFHKIFKEQMGKNIYETIKSIRLQKASNLLISNKYSTITKISKMCGYSSVTSFSRAFKVRFGQPPKDWKNGGYKKYSKAILDNLKIEIKDYSYCSAKIIRTSEKRVYYIRNRSYSKDTTTLLWQKLIAWVYSNNICDYEQMGIYHDNPIITPYEDCHYVAAIAIKTIEVIENTSLPSFITPTDVCACFDVEGKYGELLSFIQWVYHVWLPNSGYETTPNPSYTIIEKNHFLSDDGLFKVKYYIPIRYQNL